jgi:repressor of RNA polymerase III transcription MAF1
MRYLELPQLAPLNTVLSSIEADDGSRITGRVEAFSAKSAGADRKLWRHLEERFENNWKAEQTFCVGSYSSDAVPSSPRGVPSSPPGPNSAISGPMAHAVISGMPLKHLYYLIATMNLVFPDYDFRFAICPKLTI